MTTVTNPTAPVQGSVVESSVNYRRTYLDFNALERALLTHDLPTARLAFARLQEDSPHIARALSEDHRAGGQRRLHALQELAHCLRRGNLHGARQAFQRFH